MAVVSLEHVSKRWGSFVGVAEFNLRVADREFLVLLGPSGCGKTTTMRMIAGLEDPSEGTIRIGERVVNDLEPKDRDVAMVFQSYGLYPNMNVYENIRFPLKVRKVPKDTHDARVRRAAEMVELIPFLHRLPRELSGGQRQRVALARAIVRQPTVFLMDEPALQPGREAAGLDARAAQAPAARARGDDDLRHPRPGRGDDPCRPGGGDERGGHSADRHSHRDLRSPGQSLRRGGSSGPRR